MKDSSEKTIEVNNELKVNVNEHQEDKKIKLQWDIDDSDEAPEITAARTPMKKKSCVCDM